MEFFPFFQKYMCVCMCVCVCVCVCVCMKFLHGEGQDCPGEGKCETRGGLRARHRNAFLPEQGPLWGSPAPLRCPPSQPWGLEREDCSFSHDCPHPSPKENGLFGGEGQWAGGGVLLQGSLPRAGRKALWSGVASSDYPPRNRYKGRRAPGLGVLVGQTLLCTEVCGQTEQ